MTGWFRLIGSIFSRQNETNKCLVKWSAYNACAHTPIVFWGFAELTSLCQCLEMCERTIETVPVGSWYIS